MPAELLFVLACASPELSLSYCGEPDVVLNEVFAAGVEEEGVSDFVEVYNAGSETLSLAGWGLSRSEFHTEFPFPKGVTLAAGAFQYVEATVYEGAGLTTGFDLNRDGAAMYLSEADGDLCDYVIYPDQHAWYSWGRREDGVSRELDGEDEDAWCYEAPTPDGENEPCLHEEEG